MPKSSRRGCPRRTCAASCSQTASRSAVSKRANRPEETTARQCHNPSAHAKGPAEGTTQTSPLLVERRTDLSSPERRNSARLASTACRRTCQPSKPRMAPAGRYRSRPNPTWLRPDRHRSLAPGPPKICEAAALLEHASHTVGSTAQPSRLRRWAAAATRGGTPSRSAVSTGRPTTSTPKRASPSNGAVTCGAPA